MSSAALTVVPRTRMRGGDRLSRPPAAASAPASSRSAPRCAARSPTGPRLRQQPAARAARRGDAGATTQSRRGGAGLHARAADGVVAESDARAPLGRGGGVARPRRRRLRLARLSRGEFGLAAGDGGDVGDGVRRVVRGPVRRPARRRPRDYGRPAALAGSPAQGRRHHAVLAPIRRPRRAALQRARVPGVRTHGGARRADDARARGGDDGRGRRAPLVRRRRARAHPRRARRRGHARRHVVFALRPNGALLPAR